MAGELDALLGRGADRARQHAYQALLHEAYVALFSQNRRAATALIATGDAILTHSIGSHDPTDTILTAHEFCDRLTRIRSRLVGAVSDDRDQRPLGQRQQLA